MTQFVFVHGVATRSGPIYDKTVANREALLRSILFPDSDVSFYSPIWGDLVPAIGRDIFETDVANSSFSPGSAGASAPRAGLSGSATIKTLNQAGMSDFIARDPTAAIDAVFAQYFDVACRDNVVLSSDDIAAFAAGTEAIQQGTQKLRNMLAGVKTDADFAKRLIPNAPKAYGIGSRFHDAVRSVSNRISNGVSTFVFDAVRNSVSPAVGLFLGDVFAYLRQGSLRDEITERVRKALLRAHSAKKQNGGPMIVMGHSMGGVILTDMLLDPASAQLPSDLEIDTLLTVGSQPGLFRSLRIIGDNNSDASSRVRLGNVLNWYNVFDPIDPLAFRADPVFEGVEDLDFNSVTGLVSAHTAYFARPQFYARCRHRLKEKGLL